MDIAFLTSDVAKGYDHAGKCNFSVPAAQLGSSVPLVDIDSDGLFESVVCGDDGVFIYDNEGNMLDGFPVFFVNPVAEAPAVGDVNGDGYLDVVVLTDSKVHVIDHTGAELSGWPANLPTDFSPVGAPAVGDLDNDGFLEIVVGTRSFSPSNSNVCVYDKNGNAKAGFPYTLYNQAITPPALADLTDDGPVEIVVASTLYSGGTWDNAEYYVFDSAGNKTVDVALNGYSIYKTPAVGDFVTWPEWPGKEVVLIGYDSPSFYILARTATTGAYRNTISMGNEIPTSALTIGDVNFLDTNEVVIGCEDRLMAYDLACGLVPFGGDWDGTLNGAVSTPIVTDLNGNTHCDIICGDGEALYAFTTHAIFNTIGTYDWIREGHDNMNTGIWDILAPTGVVAEDVPDDQGHKITLAWTPSVDDGVRSTRVTGYKIYREAGEVGPPPGGDGLAGGTASAAALAAKRSEGRLADVAGPASPTDSAGGTDLEQDNYLLIDTVAAGTFYYEDDNLDNLREYHYYIVATDGVHNSQPSVNVYVVPRDNIAPAAPTNLACNIVDDGGDPVHVVLSWTRSVDDPLYSEGLPGDTSPDGVVARPFNRPDGTAARPVPGGVASGAGGADTAALLAAGDSAGRNGASAPVAGGTAAFPLSDKEGDAAKAKVDERVFNPGAPGIPNKSRRLWAGGDLDGGANDVENYQIMKNAATIDYYPDTQGNDVEYVDWNVSYGNMYYYSVAARDSENYSPAAGPVTADLTQIPEDYITFPGEADAPTTPGLAARTGVPGASEKINETGFGASGAEKRSKVVTCKPNPVTGTATFTINLKAGGPARLDVYDISGRRIATVLDRAVSAGGDSVTWTPTVAAGIYVYVLEAEGRHYVGKVAVAR
ncbi:MAG: T9SS type A sorting domain-containing protein [Candidatus Zixiibacteriota bacterium]